MSEEEKLMAQRAILFSLLLARMRELRFPKTPTESYYAGQEYVEDKRRISCTFITRILQPAKIESFGFWHNGARVEIIQYGSDLSIQVHRKIPQRLFDDIRLLQIRREYLVGYMTQYIPIINRKLQDIKYETNNFLVKPFSIYDLLDIAVTMKGRSVRAFWPFQLPTFPSKTELNAQASRVYIRDYIDACSSYFVGNYDECIRKVVTSIENLIREKRWKLPERTLLNQIKDLFFRRKPFNRNSFRKIIDHYIPLGTYQADTVNFNIQHIYSVRNKIVHDSFRVPVGADMFCDKAVSTLYYFLSFSSGDPEERKLLFGTRQQFVVTQQYSKGAFNLDDIERRQRTKKEFTGKPISTNEEFDRHMFSALKFTQRDLGSVT